MATPIPALVNPPLLAWAREQSGYAPEPIAKRLAVKVERLLAWERGDRRPTVRQLQALARVYHRPFGLFFLPQPPELPPLGAEYRRLPGITPGVESPELRLALRTISHRREVALELSEEVAAPFPSFELTARLGEVPSDVAKRLRTALGVTIEEQLEWKNEWQAWRRWRESVEASGALVFQFPKVPLAELRGVSLLVFPLPVIAINSKESAPGARIFTLVHELVHLALAASREERPALQERRRASEWTQVERFAEEVASAMLIPEEVLSATLSTISGDRDEWTVQRVRALAARFRVTPLAMATRLRAAGQLTWAGYRRWGEAWSEHVASLPTRKAGFASPIDKALGRAGRPFTQLVLEAMDANRITAVQASHYLDLRFDHFTGLRSDLSRSTGEAARPDDGD
jgi:Zn-dependent peptidase ImmA (M78 family)/transcriptional regulator with XRE-family HTH domain